MEVDIAATTTGQTSLMEEESEMVDIGDLDIFTLEQACKKREYYQISEKQIEKLTVALTRAQQHQKSLGIQQGGPWDGKKLFKDSKKRGRKTDLQRTILVDEMLMESSRYPKLTKFFPPSEGSSR